MQGLVKRGKTVMDGKNPRDLQEKKRRHDQRAWFWIPFAVTLSLLVLLAGLVTVEVRCRQMGLGDYTPPLALSTVTGNRTLLHYDLLGWEGDLDLTFVDNLVEYVEEKLQGVE